MAWLTRKAAPAFPPLLPIPLDSICPACGHLGCTLKFRPAFKVEVGEKREVRTTEPEMIRTCTTCGAECSQKCVLDPEKWIAK
jgi:hypothetical protein